MLRTTFSKLVAAYLLCGVIFAVSVGYLVGKGIEYVANVGMESIIERVWEGSKDD